jgi:hypothetical protein
MQLYPGICLILVGRKYGYMHDSFSIISPQLSQVYRMAWPAGMRTTFVSFLTILST